MAVGHFFTFDSIVHFSILTAHSSVQPRFLFALISLHSHLIGTLDNLMLIVTDVSFSTKLNEN